MPIVRNEVRKNFIMIILNCSGSKYTNNNFNRSKKVLINRRGELQFALWKAVQFALWKLEGSVIKTQYLATLFTFLMLATNFYLFKIHITENELFNLFLKRTCRNFAPRKQQPSIITLKKNYYGYQTCKWLYKLRKFDSRKRMQTSPNKGGSKTHL